MHIDITILNYSDIIFFISRLAKIRNFEKARGGRVGGERERESERMSIIKLGWLAGNIIYF